MINLIGIGYSIGDISERAKELIKNSDEIYLEHYTSFFENNVEELEKFLNKNIRIVGRKFVEIEIDNILNDIKKTNKTISLLIIGDPLIATTHTDLILRCKKENVKINVVNNISVLNLVTRTGLQIYKFGKIISIPFYSEKFFPLTPLILIKKNLDINSHSLILLDLNPNKDEKSDKTFLEISDAINYLLEGQKKLIENEEIKKSFIDENTKLIICSRLGFKDEKIIYEDINEILKLERKNKLQPPLCIVLPSDLHPLEEEFLEMINKTS